MSNVDVEALRVLLAKATPGPWRLEFDDRWGDGDTSVVSGVSDTICCDTEYYPTAVDPDDQALIAAAITALPSILDELTRLRAFRDMVDRCGTIRVQKIGRISEYRLVPVDTDRVLNGAGSD